MFGSLLGTLRMQLPCSPKFLTGELPPNPRLSHCTLEPPQHTSYQDASGLWGVQSLVSNDGYEGFRDKG